MATSQDLGQRLRDRIYDAIRDLVERGQFQPGQRLTEVHLAERFGVSRTPVREALFQLAREGLLEPLERGYGLRDMPMSALLARLDVKYLLDPVVVSHAIETGSRAQIGRLCTLASDARHLLLAGQSLSASASAVHDLQKCLGSACKNEVLARCFGVAEDDFLAARPLLLRPVKNRLITADYLELLLRDLARRDGVAAAAETRTYITRLEKSCRMQIGAVPDIPDAEPTDVGTAHLGV
ncbi:GntR family transcriptional regulator [Pandoraea fibrosis]|uniref:Putative HTH-type transcriptional regulator n=1 Tax=Pandoraea fibrosis TaxID=1891094 RepID=A0A5E4X2Z8_9BURK|nr:GntR family transcriptional regulator [Pandoraea fibrosis]VVE30606.1 putative HTH-type transcriptional regulator [Pandoraea fibrosis]